MNNKNSIGQVAELSSTTVLLAKDPIITYFLALGAILLGLSFIIVPALSEGFSNSKTLVPQLLMCLIGACGVTVGIVIFRIGLTETLLDRGNNLLIIRKRFNHKIITAIEVSNIQELTIDSAKDSEGDQTYRLVFKLKSGELQPLTQSSSSNKEAVELSKRKIDGLLQLTSHNGSTLSTGSNLSPNKKNEAHSGLPLPNFYESESQKKARKLLTLWATVVILITAAPFAGLWIAGQEKPSTSLEIKAGRPDATIVAKIKTQKGLLLAPEENILWVGTPEAGREGVAKIWFLPFAIIWTLFSLLWTSIALGTFITQKNFATGFMVLFGLPFVGIGLTLLSIPYVSYKRELHTIYVITEKRALSLSNDGVNVVAKFDNKHFGPIKENTYNDKRMDLLFWSSLDPESSSGDPCRGFWGIEKGEEAKAILEAKLAKRNPL